MNWAAIMPDSFSGFHNAPPVIGAIVGVTILLFGRRLFWLCVAAVGFAVGVELAPHLVQEPSPVLALTFAVVLGFVGALLALFLQKVAIAIMGFLSGGKLALAIAAAFITGATQFYWITFIIGGLVGALVLLVLFDWALIVLSSMVGAYLIMAIFTFPPTGTTISFVVLVAVGVLVQAGALRRSRAVVVE